MKNELFTHGILTHSNLKHAFILNKKVTTISSLSWDAISILNYFLFFPDNTSNLRSKKQNSCGLAYFARYQGMVHHVPPSPFYSCDVPYLYVHIDVFVRLGRDFQRYFSTFLVLSSCVIAFNRKVIAYCAAIQSPNNPKSLKYEWNPISLRKWANKLEKLKKIEKGKLRRTHF